MLVGACSNSSVPTKLQMLVERCCSSIPTIPARSVVAVVKFARKHSVNAGIVASVVQNWTETTTPPLTSFGSDGAFRRRAPEKPRCFSPGESSHSVCHVFYDAQDGPIAYRRLWQVNQLRCLVDGNGMMTPTAQEVIA